MSFRRQFKLFFNNRRPRLIWLPVDVINPVPIFNEKFPGWTAWEDLTKARSR